MTSSMCSHCFMQFLLVGNRLTSRFGEAVNIPPRLGVNPAGVGRPSKEGNESGAAKNAL